MNITAETSSDYRIYAKFESGGQIIETSWEFEVQ
jgi:hypothetical protein